jgi:K+-transporting ATPase KdpF subunit
VRDAAYVFGLVVSVLLFLYLCYALFRGENL